MSVGKCLEIKFGYAASLPKRIELWGAVRHHGDIHHAGFLFMGFVIGFHFVSLWR